MWTSVGMWAGFGAAQLALTSCTVDKDGVVFGAEAGASGVGSGGATSTSAGGATSSGASGCDTNPCRNGGACSVVAGGGYRCACVPGYGGPICEIDIDDCAVDRCENGGICADRVNDYECQCSVGYQGKNCETSKDDCADRPCQNGGECRDGNARYTCICQAGFSGLDCERTVSGCEDAPCLNGACADATDGYSCACDDGFDGINCEIDIDECRANPCKNDGECIDGVNTRTCKCKQGFSGPDCDGIVSGCDPDPCQHGGECTSDSSAFVCKCPAEWTGETCDVDVDECASPSACAGERECLNDAGGHECACPLGSVEPDCERVVDFLPVVDDFEQCVAMDVSADGSVVVGWCRNASDDPEVAFRWTPADGLEQLEGVPSPGARSVSDDGNVIAGESFTTASNIAFRWTRSTGMVSLGLQGGPVMNADGSVIAVLDQLWTASGVQSLAPMISAEAVNGSGDVIVGLGEFGQKSYRWTADSGHSELPVPSGMAAPRGLGINTDGSIIVGDALVGGSSSDSRAVIWRGAQTTVVDELTRFSGVSGDGAIAMSANPAAIWDQTNGVRDVRELLIAAGVALPQGSLYTTAISRDGRYVVGVIETAFQRQQAIRARLP